MKSLSWGFCRVNFKLLLIYYLFIIYLFIYLFIIWYEYDQEYIKIIRNASPGAWRFPLQPSTQRSQICYNTKLFGYFRLNIYNVKLFHSWEWHIVNIAIGDFSDTRLLFFLNKIHATENKHLLQIYAILNKVTGTPKRYDLYFLYLGWSG